MHLDSLLHVSRVRVAALLPTPACVCNGLCAGVNVLGSEPLPPSHPLVGLRNCLILPHMGTSTVQCRQLTAAKVIDNLAQALMRHDGGNGTYCNKIDREQTPLP